MPLSRSFKVVLDALPFNEIWCCDFEFTGGAGERPLPLCMVAIEARSRREIRLWRGEFGPQAPFPTDSRTLFVSFYASAELHCFLTLGWKFPKRILDLFVEHRAEFNGFSTIAGGNSLLDALTNYGLTAMSSADKDRMRAMIME